jgi:hypothetical protein
MRIFAREISMPSLWLAWITAVVLSIVPVAAHPGHDEVSVLVGTITKVEGSVVQVKTFDQVVMQLKTVSILIDGKTKFRLGKKRVETLELTPGQRIEGTIRTEDAPDGSIRLRGIQIRVSEPKKPA